jgi:hypothetical protein
MENTDKPEVTDAETEIDESIENIFEDAGDTDVEGKSEEAKNLSREQLEKVAGRKFESDEDFIKHYENLKNLVGDQELAKERKAKKEDTKVDKLSEMEQKLARLEKESITKDFLLATPTAKEHLDLVEAYAEKHGLSLSEAWESKVSKLAESSQSRTVINKNRITPVQSQRVVDLAERAKSGDQNATDELINTLVWKK